MSEQTMTHNEAIRLHAKQILQLAELVAGLTDLFVGQRRQIEELAVRVTQIGGEATQPNADAEEALRKLRAGVAALLLSVPATTQ